jgi:hypothetical protein
MPFFKNQQFQKVHQDLQKGNYTAAIEYMSNWKPIYLALYQTQFTTDREILSRSEFDSFWKMKREGLKLPQSHTFQFRQSNIKDVDFVTGYLFYLLALSSRGTGDNKQLESALQNALNYSSIHALDMLVNQFIVAPVERISEYCDELALALQTMEPHAMQHGTPGYLLMAKGYLHLALAARGEEEQARQAAAFKLVLKNLYWASLAEEDSVDLIHNAYFGSGVKFGNPFKIDTIDNMINYCRELSGNVVPMAVQNFVRIEALREYEARTGSATSVPVSVP